MASENSVTALQPVVHSFFDAATHTFSYIVVDDGTRACAIIDSVKGFDYVSGRTNTDVADRLIALVEEQDYKVKWLLETHIHADHLSGAPYIKSKLGGLIGIGRRILDVQKLFLDIFNFEDGFRPDGRDFDYLFDDGESFELGEFEGQVIHTPGHTPACVAYLIGDALFVGDTMFMPDVGTARCDFPGGDPHALYRSIKRLLCFPENTRVFVCHDYPPTGRAPVCETTVALERRSNLHIHEGISEEQFVSMRCARDKTLAPPTLLIPSIQVNVRAGNLPAVERNGARYIKVPVDIL